MIDCLFVPYNPDYNVKEIKIVPDYNMGILKMETDGVFNDLENVNVSIFELEGFENMKFNQIINPLREYIQKEKPRLILGLDHGISYASISALDSDNVVHVDFHHDTYEAPPIEFLAHSNWAKKLLEEGYASNWLWLHTSDYSNSSNNQFHISTYDRVIDFVNYYNDKFNDGKSDDIPYELIEPTLTNVVSNKNWLSDGDFHISICADGVSDFKDFSNDYQQRLSDLSFNHLKGLLEQGPKYVDFMEFQGAFSNPESTSHLLTYIQEIINILDANPSNN